MSAATTHPSAVRQARESARSAACVEITVAFFREAVNEGDFTVLDEFAHPDLRDMSEPRMFDDGPAGLRAAVVAARLAMPDLYARIRDVRPGDVGSVQVHLEFTGTYRAPNLAPDPRDGRRARWRQHHLWFFRGAMACAHLGRVESEAVRAGLGPRY